jgi:predicted amidohydrolase YtcJ
MTKKIVAAMAALATIGCLSDAGRRSPSPSPQQSLILQGGTVARADGAMKYSKETVVITGDRISFIGSAAEAARRFPGVRILDVEGMTILPGLVDAHAHIAGLGEALERVRLYETKSADEVVARISERAAVTPAGQWILGRGWDQNDWEIKEFPTAEALDRAVPNHPVFVRRIDGHAGLANSAAMKLAGITPSSPDPNGGRILRDATGNPTGVFIDNGMDLIEDVIPPPTDAHRRKQLIAATQEVVRRGLTGVHHAGADEQTVRVLKEMAEAGELPVRIYVMLSDNDKVLSDWFVRGPLINHADRLTVRAVKLYADGALGSRGAALIEPYSDDPSNSGLMLTTAEHIVDVARRARKAGFQVCTHAIGDGAVRTVIDSYEQADVRPADRFRIEHLQVVAPGDFDRLAERGIIASMQPTHATSDMPWAEARLGPERTRGAYAWRSVLHAGAPLAFGSDFPVEEVNPFLGFHAAVHRQDVDGHPRDGWYASERLSLAETLAAFSRGAAFAAFEEKETGDIAAGLRADLTIVATETIPAALPTTEVRYTIVGGKIVYDSTRERSMSSK